MLGHLNALYQIIKVGRNTNSYKFALARALVRLAPDTNPKYPVFAKAALARLFVEYYCPFEVPSHISQGIDPNKNPIVMRWVRDLIRRGDASAGETLADFRKRTANKYQALLAKVEKGAFGDVIPRFHSVRGAPIRPLLYTLTRNDGRLGSAIVLTSSGRAVLLEYGQLVDYIA